MKATAGGPAPPEDLPAAIPSMWRLCRLGYRHEPALLGLAFVLSLVAALPDALFAVWLKLFGEGVIDRDRTLLVVAALGLATSTAATWFLQVVSTRVQRRFRDRVTIALEAHVARLQASIATIAHQERPDYLDRLAVLRDQVFVLDHMYMSLFSTAGWLLRLAVTVGLLMSVHPALALLAAFALPTLLTSSWRPAVERAAEERGAPGFRLARHLFEVATTAAPGKEVRVTGIGPQLVRRRRAAWERWYGEVAPPRWASAAWHAAAWAVFGAGYAGAVVLVASGLNAPAGDVLLVLAAGSRLSAYINATVGEIGFLRGIWMGRAGWPGWRTMPRLSSATKTWSRPSRCATASAWSTSHSPTRGRRGSCSRMWTSTCRPGRWWPLWAKTGPARRRSSSSLRSSTSQRPAASLSTASRSPGSGQSHGVTGWRARSRTSSGSSFGRSRRSASATCRGSTMAGQLPPR